MHLLVLFALVDTGQRPAPTDKEMQKKDYFLMLHFALEEIRICE